MKTLKVDNLPSYRRNQFYNLDNYWGLLQKVSENRLFVAALECERRATIYAEKLGACTRLYSVILIMNTYAAYQIVIVAPCKGILHKNREI